MRSSPLAPLLIAALLAPALAPAAPKSPRAAEPAAPPAPAAGAGPAEAVPPAPVFSGPEVVKLDWNTRALAAADLDGDGRADLALINNDRASLELLYQLDPAAPAPARARPRSPDAAPAGRWEPALDDARFRRESLVVGQNLFDLAIADFDGDGRADLATTGEPVPLTLRLAQPDGRWQERTFPNAPAPAKFIGGLHAADIDGDGRADLVMLGQREIAIFRQRAGQGLLLEEQIPLGEDNAYGLLVADLDGDTRPDLAYLVPGRREALRVRLQVVPGKFGPELFFPLKTPRSPLVPLRSPSAAASSSAAARQSGSGAGRAAAPFFASALGASGQIEFLRLRAADGAASANWSGLSPRAYFPVAGARGAALYATGDFNRDGASDLAVAFAETAQVFVYLRQPDGAFTVPVRVPSLTDARAFAAGAAPVGGATRPAGDLLYVLSGKENALAEIVLAPDGSARPPRALALPGRLIAFAAGALGPDRPTGLALVHEEEGKRQLSLWTRGADGALVRGAGLPLTSLRTDPRAVTLADLNQDGLADVLLAAPGAGLRVYLQRPDGTLVDAADNPAYRPGLLARAEAATAPLAFGDADGDGRAELLLAAENFLRALRINAAGELEIVAQFDARDTAAEVSTGFLLPPERAGEPARVLLHDRKADQFHLLRRAAGAGAVPLDTRNVARIEVTGALQLTGPGGRAERLLLARDRFWWMPAGAADLALENLAAYTTDLPDVRPFYTAPGDFDGDGGDELVAIDLNENLVELIARDSAGAWTSRLHFKVFESDPHFQGNRGSNQEPRECVIADVTGDGRADLVLLVHDRVLVYPQEP